tara:strand:- start:901 stop:1479 length:579 start_codon:yes stop_codon:yes gene_type:complete
MKQVKTSKEALEVFDLLGVKEVTKPWQKEKGTQVFELPFKTMYANGYKEVNRFTIYRSGYVRKMLVNSSGASYSCYQLNKQYKSKRKYFNSYYKKYQTFDTTQRAMIYNEDDRLVYLCNYILKNYYRNQTSASFYRINDYQTSLIKQQSKELHETKCSNEQLPFNSVPEDDKFFSSTDDVQVIINGHRYNLS